MGNLGEHFKYETFFYPTLDPTPKLHLHKIRIRIIYANVYKNMI